MSAEIIDATKEVSTVDAQKRAFMKKFGKYAIAGAGMATLMTPTLSSANCYGVTIKGKAKEQWHAVINENDDFVAAGNWKSNALPDITNRKWMGEFRWTNEENTRAKSKGVFTFTREEQVHKGLWEGKWRFNEDKNKWIGKGNFDLDRDGNPDGCWKAWRKAGSNKITWKATGL